MTLFKTGDVVYAEGASLLLGDVIEVEDVDDDCQNVTVRWRAAVTTEFSEDLTKVEEE